MEQLIMAGKPVADHYRRAIAAKIAAAKDRGLITSLNVIVVGDDEASHVYKNRLAKMMASLGGETKEILRPASATQEEVVALIKKLNRNRYVTGILPLLPMPAPIKGAEAAAVIAANKDVDCFNSGNMGEFYAGRNRWAPCTPRACLAILDYYRISLSGKRAVILGRSNVVGKPLALLCLQRDATVTVCHTKTVNLAELCREADILFSAVGRAGFVTADMVKEGAVLVDVGINVVPDPSGNGSSLVGDIAPAALAKASAYTPVPGGVGIVSNMMVAEALCRHLS